MVMLLHAAGQSLTYCAMRLVTSSFALPAESNAHGRELLRDGCEPKDRFVVLAMPNSALARPYALAKTMFPWA